MTNVEWKNIEDMDDVRAKRTYQEAVDQGKNPQEVLAYFSELGRDNARTPMQWSDEKNGGFSIGIPWIKCNDNYQVINVEHQIHNPGSLYNYYKRLIKCYHDHADIVKNGAFHTLYENEPGLIAYEREWNGTVLTVAVNFTNQKLAMPYIDQPCILHNYKAVNTSQMQPYEARIYYGRSAEA